jgi:hypothetical protein
MLLHGWLDREALERAKASGLVANLQPGLRREIESDAAFDAIESWWMLMAKRRGVTRLLVHRQLGAGELAILASSSLSGASELSGRTRNLLVRAGIRSVLDLATTPIGELGRVQGCGRKTLKELEQFIERLLSKVH